MIASSRTHKPDFAIILTVRRDQEIRKSFTCETHIKHIFQSMIKIEKKFLDIAQ